MGDEELKANMNDSLNDWVATFFVRAYENLCHSMISAFIEIAIIQKISCKIFLYKC